MAMSKAIQTVLVDPDCGSRSKLSAVLGELPEIVVVGTYSSYQMAVQALASDPPQLILVAVESDREQALELIRAIKRAKPGAVVIPASDRLEGQDVLRFVRAGAPDYLHLPATADDVRALIERLPALQVTATAATTSPRDGSVIAVTGASGGVGCSSIAVNLAAVLAEDRAVKVALLDLDLLYGSIAASLNLHSSHGLLEVIESSDRLDHQLLHRSLIHDAGTGLFVLPGPETIEDSGRIEPEPLGSVLGMLAELFDHVVVDTSKALHVTDMIALERADRILLVVQSDLVNLYHSARLLGLFKRLDRLDERIRVILNRAGSEAGSISTKKVEGTLGKPVYAQIPNAFRAFQDARTYGKPIDRRGAGKRARPAIEELARRLRAEFAPATTILPAADPACDRNGFWSSLAGERGGRVHPATA